MKSVLSVIAPLEVRSVDSTVAPSLKTASGVRSSPPTALSEHTDFILAVIGEGARAAGAAGVVALYAMIAWAGLRTSRLAVGHYAKLLAAGLTSLILCHAILNIFVVLGLAPLTGVSLAFISCGPTNPCILRAALGMLLNAQPWRGRAGANPSQRAKRASVGSTTPTAAAYPAAARS